MCDRYACYLDLTFERDWKLAGRAPAFTHYNIAPDCDVPIVRHGVDGQRECVMARWGLVPALAHGQRRRQPRINVAASTLPRRTPGAVGRAGPSASRGSAVADVWRRSHRCIFPMRGFYLWERGAAGAPVPWFASLARQKMFGVAGLWDRSVDPRRDLHFFSAAMITLATPPLAAEPGPAARRIPAILPIDAYDTWLGADAAAARGLLRPLPPGELHAWRVGPQVLDLNNRGPACMEPPADE
jgi:putative SOS response-associated peptidase YedK